MEVGDLGAEPLSGDLEREEGAGGILEKGVDLGEAARPAILLARLPVERGPPLRLVEDGEDVLAGQSFDAEQVTMRKGADEGCG
jgi:hypothetical protein